MELDPSTADRDREIVLQLRASLGADQTITVVSHLIVRDQPAYDQLRQLLIQSGFIVAERMIGQYPLTWELAVFAHRQPEPDDIAALRVLMERSAAAFGAHYDGWQALPGRHTELPGWSL
jgi:hypothetical protein